MGCKMPDTCVPGKFCPAQCDWEKEMTCPGKLEIAGIHAQWIVVKMQSAQEQWIPRVARCLILVCLLVWIAQKCKEVFQSWMLRDHLLFYMLKMLWIYNLKIL